MLSTLSSAGFSRGGGSCGSPGQTLAPGVDRCTMCLMEIAVVIQLLIRLGDLERSKAVQAVITDAIRLLEDLRSAQAVTPGPVGAAPESPGLKAGARASAQTDAPDARIPNPPDVAKAGVAG